MRGEEKNNSLGRLGFHSLLAVYRANYRPNRMNYSVGVVGQWDIKLLILCIIHYWGQWSGH